MLLIYGQVIENKSSTESKQQLWIQQRKHYFIDWTHLTCGSVCSNICLSEHVGISRAFGGGVCVATIYIFVQQQGMIIVFHPSLIICNFAMFLILPEWY